MGNSNRYHILSSIILHMGISAAILLLVIILLVYESVPNYRAKDYYVNFKNNEESFSKVVDYYYSIFPDYCDNRYHLSITIYKDGQTILVSLFSITSANTFISYYLDKDCSEYDDLLNVFGWSKENVDTLEMYLKNINCTSILNRNISKSDSRLIEIMMEKSDFNFYLYSSEPRFEKDSNNRDFLNEFWKIGTID